MEPQDIQDQNINTSGDSQITAQVSPMPDTPEFAKATLGLATRLSEQFLMAQAPQQPEEAPQEGEQEEPGEQPETPEEETPEEQTKEDERVSKLETDVELLKKLVLEDKPSNEDK